MSFYSTIRTFNVDKLDVIYTGPNMSFYCTIRAFNVDQLDVIYIGSDMSFYCAIQTFKLSQLGVNYTGPDRSLAFMRHPDFVNGLLQRLIENALKEALLIIPLPGSRLSPI